MSYPAAEAGSSFSPIAGLKSSQLDRKRNIVFAGFYGEEKGNIECRRKGFQTS
jgi:hypothetical protein